MVEGTLKLTSRARETGFNLKLTSNELETGFNLKLTPRVHARQVSP